MKLYHGTSYKYLYEMLLNGIKPRFDMKSNWEEYPSNKDKVYLTTTYPFLFSYCASNKNVMDGIGIVLELDSNFLNFDLMYPDEDYVWDRLKDDVAPHLVKNLHTKVRNNLENVRHLWVPSVQNIGNCSYQGVIKPEAIQRVCIVDWKKRPKLTTEILEPTISIANHTFCGEHYRKMVQWFFNDIKDLPQIERTEGQQEMFPNNTVEYEKAINYWKIQSKNRKGINIINL